MSHPWISWLGEKKKKKKLLLKLKGALGSFLILKQLFMKLVSSLDRLHEITEPSESCDQLFINSTGVEPNSISHGEKP